MENKNTDKKLAEFTSDDRFIVTIVSADCDKNHSELINHLKKQGYEVWPEIRTSNNKECDIIYRKLKEDKKAPSNV